MAAPPDGPPGGARALRQRIVIQRQPAATGTALGGLQGGWQTIIASRFASLKPMTARRGDAEQVIAARLQGTALWDCWVRYDSETAGIVQGDRCCDARTAIAGTDDFALSLRVRFVQDMSGRQQWIFMQLEAGVAQGVG